MVIECGTTSCRVGLAGEASPRLIFPPVLGKPKPPGAHGAEMPIGDAALENRATHAMKHPIDHGIPFDMDGVERLWRHSYAAGVEQPPDAQPVLLGEAPGNPRSCREQLVQLMFEKLSVPALALVPTPVLVLAAHGLRTGLVIESGEQLTHIVCVYEGHVLRHTLPRPFFYRGMGGGRAGGFVTDRLLSLLAAERGVAATTVKERGVVQRLKEEHAYAAPSSEAGALDAVARGSPQSDEPPAELVCPLLEAIDGHTSVTLGAERHQCVERLFSPAAEELNLSQGDGIVAGLHEAAWQAVQSCPVELRQIMCEHVVLSGGNAMLSGFAERMRRELGALARAHDLEVRLVPRPEAQPDWRLDAWVGASTTAADAAFEARCITRAEYDEHGPAVVHRKCF